jgi:prepilin-type N-terminal cleavage/methylation domain-containing protein
MNGFGNRGFTLVEVLVAMALFIGIILITGSSFNTILSQSSSLQRSEESNIEGVVGLEMLRHDLQQAGYGLFTDLPPMEYSEASVAPASTYNDSTTHVPRPLLAGNDLNSATTDDAGDTYNLITGTDYLVIKGTTVGRSSTAQKWSYMELSGGVPTIKNWPSHAENFENSEYFVLLRRQFSTPPRLTIERNAADTSLWFRANSPAFDAYTTQGNSVFTMYGIDSDNFRMPFNRTDYFIARPADATKVPTVCAPNTGILYKSTVIQNDDAHNGGKLKYMPVVDCAAEMQVVLGWDMDNNGTVDTWSNAEGSIVSGAGSGADVAAAISQANNDDITAANIRNRLKVVKIYIIAQDGKKDLGYSSPAEITIGDDGEKSLIHDTGTNSTKAAYALAANMRNYRWKEYRVIVRPKNLQTNQ